jgi:hypothetical protein
MKAAEYRVKIEQAGGGPSRDEIITSAYRRALNREPDPAGKKNAVEILSQFSPRDLLRRLIASPEFAESYLKGKSREQATTVVYRIILGREPTATERKYLAGKETVYEERRSSLADGSRGSRSASANHRRSDLGFVDQQRISRAVRNRITALGKAITFISST